MNRILNRFRRMVRDCLVPRVIRNVQADSLTFLDQQALIDLYQSVRNCERAKLDGVLIEAGCAAGGSAIVMAAAKSKSRPLLLYDIFGLIPPPSNKDGEDVLQRYQVIKQGKAEGLGNRGYYGYEPDLMAQVSGNFARHGYTIEANKVSLIKGLFSDTIKGSEPVALAHLDGDWYDSVMVYLERIAPRLVRGGTLIIDDYEAWSGCRKAVDEYFAQKKGEFEFVQKSRLHIKRMKKTN